MQKIQVLCFFLSVAVCLGGGGGGGSFGGAVESTPEEGDGVKILKVPKPLQLTCNITTASGDNIPIDWYKDNVLLESSERVRMEGTNLRLEPTERTDVGQYKCQSKTDASVSKTTDVVTLGYKKLPKSTTALEGDQFSLTCDAEGEPEPTITWLKDELPIEESINGTDRLEFRASEKGLANATIVLTDIQQSDRGVYTCLITNHPGLMFNSTTNVRVKDIYAALWPFLGIVVEVVVLCVIIFIYEKRRSKSAFSDQDGNAASDGAAVNNRK